MNVYISLKKRMLISLSILCILFISRAIFAETNAVPKHGYIANQESVKGIFGALSSHIKKPIILSKLAARKVISGTFNVEKPQNLMEELSHKLGLIWYQDGETIYVYDSSEMRSEVIALQNTSLTLLTKFLEKSSLLDKRYPLRGDEASATFYISGPPIYVELIKSSAKLLDGRSENYDGREKVAVIQLYNAFVEDRVYSYRGEKVLIPGIANVVHNLLGDGVIKANILPTVKESPTARLSDPNESALPPLNTTWKKTLSSNPMKVIANPNTNSLLVRGSSAQINYARNIISELDTPKRHIELSVWIVDVQKDLIDQLGVKWSGSINYGSRFGISLNGGTSTLDGGRFLASILALSQNGKANVVSRPMVLTQENIPAIFDNNRTFYTQLIGERSVELEHVTYGTLVSVLPRFTESNEVEMMLNIEDGNQFPNESSNGSLPEVGRTNISTIARVPKGKSLLIGGYTRDEYSDKVGKIPLLGNIPFIGWLFRYEQKRTSNMIRLFLIQPREITETLRPDANQFIAEKFNSAPAVQLNDWVRNYMDSQHGINKH